MNIPKRLIFLFTALVVLPQCAKKHSYQTTQQASTSSKKAMPMHNTTISSKASSSHSMPQASIAGTINVQPPHEVTHKPQQKILDPQELTKGVLPVTAPEIKKLPLAHMPSANRQEENVDHEAIKPELIISTPQPGLIVHKSAPQKQQAPEAELDFKIENLTGKTIYATCFAYMRTRINSKWRWRKSPIYKIHNKQTVEVDIATIPDREDRNNVFGVLGIFDSPEEANNATYELTPDKNKLDLDQLVKLKGQKVVIETERYGFKKPFFEYDFVKTAEEIKSVKGTIPELDFLVVNNTKKPLYICGFAYIKKAKGTWIAAVDEKDDMAPWRYDKTPVLRVEHGQTAYIDIDTIVAARDRENVLGFLGIFNENEEKLAHKSTYELLSPRHKLALGNLKRLTDKKIILEIEQYGTQGDIIDYVVKPVKYIDWTKAVGKPR